MAVHGVWTLRDQPQHVYTVLLLLVAWSGAIRAAQAIVAAMVSKCLNGRPNTVKLVGDCCNQFVELEGAEAVTVRTHPLLNAMLVLSFGSQFTQSIGKSQVFESSRKLQRLVTMKGLLFDLNNEPTIAERVTARRRSVLMKSMQMLNITAFVLLEGALARSVYTVDHFCHDRCPQMLNTCHFNFV